MLTKAFEISEILKTPNAQTPAQPWSPLFIASVLVCGVLPLVWMVYFGVSKYAKAFLNR